MATRFLPGDWVRVRKDTPSGHCRTPFYLRGLQGVIERSLGAFRNPERLAYGEVNAPELALYQVRFEQRHIWEDYPGPNRDTLTADIFEPWLEATPARSTP